MRSVDSVKDEYLGCTHFNSTMTKFMYLLLFVNLIFICLVFAVNDDLYDVLGVSRSASTQEIKQAYKNLAKEWHPDKNQDPSANARFIKINEAYETLSSEEKRAEYDTYGTRSSHLGQEQRWSDADFPGAGGSFSFGRFTFTFGGSSFDSSVDQYRLVLRKYEDTVIPESRHKPYVIFVYSEYCDECSRVEGVWQLLVQDLVKADIGVGTVNYEAEKLLVKKLRVGGSFPSVVGVVDGRLRWFTNPFDLQNLREFVRSLFPNDLIHQVSNASVGGFLDSWEVDNKVRVLFFDVRKLPPLRFVAAAFAYRRHIAAGYVNMVRLECDWMVVNYHLVRTQENLLIFKEDVANPAIRITMPELRRSDMNEAIEAHKFLDLPRISSPAMFYDYCQPQSPLDNRKLCVVLLSRRIPQHNSYRDSFREFAKRHVKDRLKFAYIYEETQKPFVRLMTWEAGAANDTQGTLKVAVMWRKYQKTVHYDLLEHGWHASGSDLQRSRRKLIQIVDWLLQTRDVLPYVMHLRSEIIDEHAEIIWIRVFHRILTWIDRIWDKILGIDEILLLTVVTTAILVIIIGMAVRVLMVTEDSEVQKKLAPQSKNQKSVSQKKTSLEIQTTDGSNKPTVYIHPLCCENYEELVLQGESGVRLMVILVDETSRSKLLQYFAWILLPYLKSLAFKVAFLQLEEYLPWYRSLLEATTGLLEGSAKAKRNLTRINMRNCLGTVLAVNGRRKFYHIYHYSTMKTNTNSWMEDDPTAEETDHELKSDAKKLFESDLVRGLGRWMDQLCNGKLKKYRVSFWPEMKT